MYFTINYKRHQLAVRMWFYVNKINTESTYGQDGLAASSISCNKILLKVISGKAVIVILDLRLFLAAELKLRNIVAHK